ncbi:hypothetical protein [Nocardia sp. NPDC050793]|uniref:TetR/AcrR family transcriptional regulator n=1 Tax=Nocardia sp. NPDC050793 TaxID=3155159 RepID=UPI0033F69862
MTTNRRTGTSADELGEYQQLLAATASLFLTRRYDATSVGFICVHADTRRGRFFRHFDHKYDAAHAVAAHLTGHALRRIDGFTPCDGEHLLATLTTWARLLATRPGWVWLELDLADLASLSRAEVHARAECLRRAVANLFARSPGLDASERTDSEREQLVSLLFTLVLGMAIQHTHATTLTTATVRSHLALILGTDHSSERRLADAADVLSGYGTDHHH